MSWLEQYHALARYNQWMNRKLYNVCAQLDDSERKRDRGAFFKSIHGTFNHLLVGDSVWLGRFTRDAAAGPRDSAGQPFAITALAQELHADFGQLTRERERIDTLLLAYANQLDEAQLTSEVRYKTIAGDSQGHVLWWALGHLFNHQTHHRGQVTTLLSQAGLDVGSTDLATMLRAERSTPAP